MPSQEIRRKKRMILSLANIVRKLAIDLSIDPQDRNYVLRRLQHEGCRFLSKTLPEFSKYVLKCCEAQKILDCRLSGLTHFESKRGVPVFMTGLLYKVLGSDRLLAAAALKVIRQFCEYFYKTAFGFETEVLKSAEEKYLKNDIFKREQVDWEWVEKGRKALETHYRVQAPLYEVFRDIRPHDGPGSVARSRNYISAFDLPLEVIKRLPGSRIGHCRRDLRGYSGYFKSYPSSKEEIRFVEEAKVAEVLFVPKDSRGPRVISKEPLFLLKAQMAVGKWLSGHLQHVTDGSIQFTNQDIMQQSAQKASLTRQTATLDLKDASDRVWNLVVKRLGRNLPIFRSMQKIRSTCCILPSGLKKDLEKFANMGSGLCFPVLALVVHIAACLAVSQHLNIPYRDAMKLVRVYGDDLQVPTCCYTVVVESLNRFGLRVNQDKSYYRGFFRESCGGDFFYGMSVAPTRLRLAGEGLDPVRDYRNGYVPLRTPNGILQCEKHCRELIDAGLYNTATYYYSILQRGLGALPIVVRESNTFGIFDPDNIIRNSLLVLPVYSSSAKTFFATTEKFSCENVCPRKGLARHLRPHKDDLDDFRLTPLRRKLQIKCRVPDLADIEGYGLTAIPEYIKMP